VVEYYRGDGSGFDYVQAAEPPKPKVGESWFDTNGGGDGNGEAKVYQSDGTWEPTGYISHDNLLHIDPADHHDPVTVSAPITRSAQALALAYADGLTLDANDDLAADLGDGVTMDSNGRIKASLGNALAISGGSIAVQEGQISHDNISGVSDADHHDPVTVSAPLTRSTQALALAIANGLRVDGNNDLAVDAGNALTFNTGTLAVQEGNISLSNLTGYPIGTGDLGFDTATQSELDNHVSSANVHHSPPTSTSGTSSSGTWHTILQDNSNTTVDGIYCPVAAVRADDAGSDVDVTFNYANGTSDRITNNSQTITDPSGKVLVSVSSGDPNSFSADAKFGPYSHSHNI